MPGFESRRLATVDKSSLTVVGYRNQAPGFDPKSGEGARRFGGRFNPPKSFPVVYLCLTRPCVVAELTRQAERQGISVADLLPRELWAVQVELDGVLDLTDPEVLELLDLDPADLTREGRELTHEVGEAAFEQGFQAIKSRSAAGVDEVLAVFVERLAGAVLDVELVEEWTELPDLGG